MGLFYWFNLFGSVLLMMLAGLFIRSYVAWQAPNNIPSVCQSSRLQHPFLCGDKVPIAHAHTAALARVEGISVSSAKRIHDFVSSHPQTQIADLIAIPGIGPKSIARMREHFY